MSDPREGDEIWVRVEGVPKRAEVLEIDDSLMNGRYRLRLEIPDAGEEIRHVERSAYATRLVMREEDCAQPRIRDLRCREASLLADLAELRSSASINDPVAAAAKRELRRALAAVQKGIESRGGRTAEVTAEAVGGDAAVGEVADGG